MGGKKLGGNVQNSESTFFLGRGNLFCGTSEIEATEHSSPLKMIVF